MPTKSRTRKNIKKLSRKNSRRISKKLSRKNSIKRKNLRKRNSMKQSRKNKKLRGGSIRIVGEGTALGKTTSHDIRKNVCKILTQHGIDLGNYYTVKQNDNKSYTVNSLEDNCSEEIKQAFTVPEQPTMDRPKEIKQPFTTEPQIMDRS